MPNLDIIYDVTTEVTCNERKTNKQVIYQTTSLPSFFTFDGFYFCLLPKTLSFERYLDGKALATDHRGNSIKHPKVELTTQARNFTTNVPKIIDRKSSSEQIFSEN